MAAQDSDLEKTELPSQHKLDQAREEGNVPRSRELAACVSLLAGGLLLWMMGSDLQGALSAVLRDALSFSRAEATDPVQLLEQVGQRAGRVIWHFLPFAAIIVALSIVAPLLVGGWIFALKNAGPRFSRIDPLAGIGRMVSVDSLAEFGKAVVKAVLVGVVAWLSLSRQWNELLALPSQSVNEQASALADLLLSAFFPLAGTLALIAAVDVPWQRWRHTRQLMMTREEVRQEHKEQEGSPEVKGRIRALQREMARRRMMSAIPTADVVITNPTHYAVALSYSESSQSAPRVVAKGTDEMAARIRALAAEHRVPLLESPPLARALYRHVEIGDAIPEKLYTAVAQVLAYVFQLRSGGDPERPTDIAVPEGMDVAAGERGR